MQHRQIDRKSGWLLGLRVRGNREWLSRGSLWWWWKCSKMNHTRGYTAVSKLEVTTRCNLMGELHGTWNTSPRAVNQKLYHCNKITISEVYLKEKTRLSPHRPWFADPCLTIIFEFLSVSHKLSLLYARTMKMWNSILLPISIAPPPPYTIHIQHFLV